MRTNYFRKIFFYFTIIVLFAITGCKKDDEPTKTELITKEWRIISIDGESAYQYFDGEEVILKFETDGDFKITRFYDGDSETSVGKWNWEDKEELLEVEMDGEQVNWELYKLTTTEFWFFDTDEDELFKCESN